MDVEVWLEPFGGGAGAAIAAVRDHGIPEAWIVERNPALAAFWGVLLSEGEWLAETVARTIPTLGMFDQSKEVLVHHHSADRRELAFAAFFVNRCSRSGILTPNVGPIGGRHQSGRYTIADRFNPHNLATRLRETAAIAPRLRAFEGDGIGFVEDLPASGLEHEVFVFADPPYFVAGPRLYAEGIGEDGHRRLADALAALPGAWICTYDADPRVVELYGNSDVLEFEMQHTAARSRPGLEYLISSPGWLDEGLASPRCAPMARA